MHRLSMEDRRQLLIGVAASAVWSAILFVGAAVTRTVGAASPEEVFDVTKVLASPSGVAMCIFGSAWGWSVSPNRVRPKWADVVERFALPGAVVSAGVLFVSYAYSVVWVNVGS